LDKEEEKLRSKVIEYLSIIDEQWDEGISQSLMSSDINYDNAFELCLDMFEVWIKALRLLDQLRKKNKVTK